jgi:hypothetical protein
MVGALSQQVTMVGTFLMALVLVGRVQGGDVPTPAAAGTAARPHADLTGTWNYNPDESVNAATNKPETARAANDRRGVTRGPLAAGGAPRNGGFAGGGRGAGGGGAGVPQDGLYTLYIEQRDARRDLLEIAPTLTISVTPEAFAVTDDLDRTLKFPVDGKKQKYQLGAAQFDARTSWDGPRLKTEIEGPDGLKISETWFLSDDGSRLFVVIRVGDTVKDGPPVGVNRVYDRAK